MSAVSPERITKRLTRRLFNGPLLQNNVRGDYVEEMIALTLEPAWRMCSGDWYGWDFENDRGIRIQVKQSAAKQTWGEKPYAGRFSVSPAKGYWLNGTDWIVQPGRPADLYIFAWHPVLDETCDHTDPSQWELFVVPERKLPLKQRSIQRSVLEKQWTACDITELAENVSQVSALIPALDLKANLVPVSLRRDNQ